MKNIEKLPHSYLWSYEKRCICNGNVNFAMLYSIEDLDTSMSTITSMDNVITEHDRSIDSDEKLDVEEREPQFSDASSEHDMFQCPESNSDLSESELSSDDKEPRLPTL